MERTLFVGLVTEPVKCVWYRSIDGNLWHGTSVCWCACLNRVPSEKCSQDKPNGYR